jgi:hypothetical protein
MHATANALPREAVQVRVILPKEIADLYEIQAEDAGFTLEQVLQERLQACVYHDSDKPLYFSDQQRQELDSLLKRNVGSAEKALLAIRSQLTVDVNGIKVLLAPNTLQRLKSRCFGKPFEQFFRETVNRVLEEFVVMR